MREKNEIKKLLIIVIVLAFILIGLLLYKSFILSKNNDDIKDNLDEIAYKLYYKITNSKYSTGYHTFYEVNNLKKLKMAYDNIDAMLIIKQNYNSDSCIEEVYQKPTSLYYTRNSCLVEIVKKDDFEASYKDLFGSNAEIQYTDFGTHGLITCRLDNEEIKCYQLLGGIDIKVYESLNLEKYESDNDEIYLYINSIVKDNTDDNLIGKGNNIIDNSSYFDSLLINYEITGENLNVLFEHYKGKTIDYKVTFKKDSNGNYYWISTELLK